MDYTDPHLPSVKHFRDVGKSINQIASRKLLEEGVLFISSLISDASPAENEYLRNTLGIRTVVDTAWENTRTRTPAPQQQQQQRDPKEPAPPSWLHINRILGLTYCGVKWRRGPYINDMISGVSLWQRARIFGNVMIEDQANAAALLARVALDAGPTNESFRVLDNSKVMIGELWNTIFGEEDSYPILMIGDRDSSIFVIVVLLFLEVPTEIVSQTVEQSILFVQSTVEAPFEEGDVKFTKNYLRNAGTWVGDVERWLRENYGGVQRYAMAAGVSNKAQDAVERVLLVDSDEKLVEV